MTKPTEREQKLVDIMFEIAMRSRDMKDVPTESHAAWIRHQLQQCGFPCAPMGMSHAVLMEY